MNSSNNSASCDNRRSSVNSDNSSFPPLSQRNALNNRSDDHTNIDLTKTGATNSDDDVQVISEKIISRTLPARPGLLKHLNKILMIN